MTKNKILSQIISRNDTSQNWKTKNPILAQGEIGYDSTNKKIKIGDGTSHWNDLKYILLDELDKKVDINSDKLLTEDDKKIINKFEETGSGVGVKSEFELTAETINTNNIVISANGADIGTDAIGFHNKTGNYTLTDVLNKKLYYYGNIDISSNTPVIYANENAITTWPTQLYDEPDGKIYTITSKLVDKGLNRSDLGIDRLETKISGVVYIVFKYNSSNGDLSMINIINPDKCVPTLKKLTIKISSISINSKNYKITTTYTPDFSDINYSIKLGSSDVSYADGTGGDGTAYAELLNYMSDKITEQVTHLFSGTATDCMILNTNSVYVGESIYWNGLCWVKLSPDMSKYYTKNEITDLGHISYQGTKTVTELNSVDNSSNIKTKGYMYNVQFDGDSTEIENYTYRINGSVVPGTITKNGTRFVIKYSAENYTNSNIEYDELRRLISSIDIGYNIYAYINSNLFNFKVTDKSGSTITVLKKSGPSITDNSAVDIQAVQKNTTKLYNINDYVVWNGTDWITLSRSVDLSNLLNKSHSVAIMDISQAEDILSTTTKDSRFNNGDQYTLIEDESSIKEISISCEVDNPTSYSLFIYGTGNGMTLSHHYAYGNILYNIHNIKVRFSCSFEDDDKKTWQFEIDDINKYDGGDLEVAINKKIIRVIYDGNLATSENISALNTIANERNEIELIVNSIYHITESAKIGDTLVYVDNCWINLSDPSIDLSNYITTDDFTSKDKETITNLGYTKDKGYVINKPVSLVADTSIDSRSLLFSDTNKSFNTWINEKADKTDLTSVYKIKGSLDVSVTLSEFVNDWYIGTPQNGYVYNIEKLPIGKSVKSIFNNYNFTADNITCVYTTSSGYGILTFTDSEAVKKIGNCRIVLKSATSTQATDPITDDDILVKFVEVITDNTVKIETSSLLISGNTYILNSVKRDDINVSVGDNIVWIDNYGWDKLAGVTDLSDYVLKSDLETSINTNTITATHSFFTNIKLDSFDFITNSNNTSISNLLDSKINKSDIVNTLNSTTTSSPLAAYQGKVLNEKFSTAKFKPSQIIAENDNTSGSVPLGYGAETHSVRNVSSFLPADAIYVEYTTDGGTTWTDYGSDFNSADTYTTIKLKQFAELTDVYLKVGGANMTNDNITDQCMTRVIIDPTVDGRYSNAFMFYCWVNTSGASQVQCKIECSTMGDKDTFTTVRDYTAVSGWSGPNTITFTPKTFGGGKSQLSNQCKYRFTFRTLSPNGKTPSVTDMRLYGYSVWIGKNNYMTTGTVYKTSYLQNVTFPNQVSAKTLEIESEGSIGTNLTTKIQNMIDNIPISSTIPSTLVKNTIYDVGQQTSLQLNLPSSGKVGDYIQVDFLSPSTPTTLGINSSAGISDFSLVPSANTIYSLYFEWGTLYYNSSTSKLVYGWRFKYDEYTHTA